MSIPLIDTNILVYVFDKSEKEKHSACANLLDRCWLEGEKYAVSVQNLSEFYHITTQKIQKPLKKEFAEKIVKRIIEFDNFRVINFDENTVLSAIEINKKYNIHYFDALLAATMRESGIFKIYTEDSDFKKVPWLEVVDPIVENLNEI